ncbi:MAG TPA: 4-deoxy-4-formamido-L-arabinose-phosphoundecaprenol deformylase [Burkholderiales bacterium]|nr:4-deoxy-4-formamido-L-arabinose-phosphoundecaprenol deformylase [Burkholderiales bacterium]
MSEGTILHLEANPLAADAIKIAVKIDVHTLRGTREGVPALIEMLERYRARATFLFSLGPDSAGRQLRGALLRAITRGARPPRLLGHYGWNRLLSGALLPPPDIGERCGEVLRSVRAAGFEVGVRSIDEASWDKQIDRANATWTRLQMERARARFREVFGENPRVHAAAGWRMNRHAYRLTQLLGFDYCSDTLGTQPYVPIYQAELIACPQLPTTLPTMANLLDQGLSSEAAAERILSDSESVRPSGHVYNAHAEVEGLKLKPHFERLLQTWKSRNVNLLSLSDYFDALPDKDLPRHEVSRTRLPRGSRDVAVQGEEFLAGY